EMKAAAQQPGGPGIPDKQVWIDGNGGSSDAEAIGTVRLARGLFPGADKEGREAHVIHQGRPAVRGPPQEELVCPGRLASPGRGQRSCPAAFAGYCWATETRGSQFRGGERKQVFVRVAQ